MRILMVSHKPCWVVAGGRCVATDGGFPTQVEALAGLFDELRVVPTISRRAAHAGLREIRGQGVTVSPLTEPRGHGLIRKITWIVWISRHLRFLKTQIHRHDAVHAAIPGDVGTSALMLALLAKKPLFIRHCGTWDDRSTLANRFLAWLLPRIAGGRVVVMATGGGPEPPEPSNPAIEWIFATSLREAEYEELVPAEPWVPSSPLRLVTVGRVTRGKNAVACLEAMPGIRRELPNATLTVVGDGKVRGELEQRAFELGLRDAVEFTGNLDHEAVMDVLQRSHLFLFPTRVAEGFPKAVLEAMACGLPVVASRVSVLPYLLGEGHGVLLDGTEPADVERAVIDLVRDTGRMAVIGGRARLRAADYTLERWRELIGERLERAWGRPLREPPATGSSDREQAS